MSRWAVIAVAMASIAVLVTASSAGACSCAGGDPREALERSDAAVIGTAIRSEEVDGRRLTHLRVERAFKAELGAEVVVDTGRAGGDDGECTLVLADGARVGLFLSRTDSGGWSSGVCSQVGPDELGRAAEPIPAPLGRGDVAFVAALGLRGHRLAALDARGRVLAYGRGAGLATNVEVCPGAQKLIEIVHTGRRREAVIRRLPDLRVIRRVGLPRTEGLDVECLDPGAHDLLVLAHDSDEPVAHGRLLRFTGARRRLVHRGTAVGMAVSGRFAYLETGRWGGDILALDLRTGARRHVATIPRIPGELIVSPDGRALATVAYNPFGTSYAVIIRPGARQVVRRVPLGLGAQGDLAWIGSDRVAYGGDGSDFRLFDGALRTVRHFRTHFGGSSFMTARRGTLFGVEEGRLLSARLPGLRVRRLEYLPSSDVFALTAITGAPPLRARAAASRRAGCAWSLAAASSRALPGAGSRR